MLTTGTLHEPRRRSRKRTASAKGPSAGERWAGLKSEGEAWEGWQRTGEDGMKRLSLAWLPQPGVVRELCDLEGEGINRFSGSV